MGQEPGTNSEIKSFCESSNVSFDLFEKVSVKGKDQCGLYQYLTSETVGHDHGGAVKWNFQKYLVDKKGHVIAKFGPREDPMAESVTKLIETELAKN